MTSNNLHISEPFTLKEIEQVYEESILKQEFYNSDYAVDWINNSEPFKEMAKYIKDTFDPKKVLDVGCGIGMLVKELRMLGVDGYGVEYSKDFINLSPVKDYILEGTVFDLDRLFGANSFDVVVCMEVLEHIPPTRLNAAIQSLKRIAKNNLVITMPSYGPNVYGYYGLPLNEKPWLRDARENVPFKNLVVDENNIPDLGHISLATYKWWSLKFLKNGLIRNLSSELKGYNFHGFLKYRWNAYVLSKCAEGNINICSNNYFCDNLFDVENWGNEVGNVRWTQKNFSLTLVVNTDTNNLFLKFYSGPREIVYDRCFTIKVCKLHENSDLRLFLKEQAVKTLIIEPDIWYDVSFDINAHPYDILILECEVSESFVPNYFLNNGDCRQLGVAISSFGVKNE